MKSMFKFFSVITAAAVLLSCSVGCNDKESEQNTAGDIKEEASVRRRRIWKNRSCTSCGNEMHTRRKTVRDTCADYGSCVAALSDGAAQIRAFSRKYRASFTLQNCQAADRNP